MDFKEYSNSDVLKFIEEDIFTTSIPLGNLIATVQEDVPINDPINDPLNVTINDRMKYIIDHISTHIFINMEVLLVHFQVSEKTIKRDLLILNKIKLLSI